MEVPTPRSEGPASARAAGDRGDSGLGEHPQRVLCYVRTGQGSLVPAQTMSFLRSAARVAESTPQAETYFSTVPYWLFI